MAHRLRSIFHKQSRSANAFFPNIEGMPSHPETNAESPDRLSDIQEVNSPVANVFEPQLALSESPMMQHNSIIIK
jgi:hypothetical protein